MQINPQKKRKYKYNDHLDLMFFLSFNNLMNPSAFSTLTPPIGSEVSYHRQYTTACKRTGDTFTSTSKQTNGFTLKQNNIAVWSTSAPTRYKYRNTPIIGSKRRIPKFSFARRTMKHHTSSRVPSGNVVRPISRHFDSKPTRTWPKKSQRDSLEDALLEPFLAGHTHFSHNPSTLLLQAPMLMIQSSALKVLSFNPVALFIYYTILILLAIRLFRL